jgi:methyltransferase-like protein/trans-aconitate methyltransferase
MTLPFSYDTVEYPAHVYPQLHPARLAAIARLHRVPATSPRRCRLLEVGCGDGLQLLTLALSYPDSTFVGVDLSATAIARGEAMRRALGLDNLQLIHADLLAWQPQSPVFDYIIAHGFYSWVPAPVRERLLWLCETHLAENGIACISYNALPGCHLRQILWDVLKFHSGPATAAPQERITRALQCLELLAAGMPSENRYAAALAGEIEELKDRLNPNVLFHDDLAEINQPFTLDAFMRDARAHRLEFVAEASYHEMSLRNVNEAVRPMLEALAKDDPVSKEQYLDYLTGRRFRQTLLCRHDAAPASQADASAIATLQLASPLSPDPQGQDARGALRFSHPASGGVSTDHPVMQALLAQAARHYPVAVNVTTLVNAARDAANSTQPYDTDLDTACRFLLRTFEVGIVELYCDAPRFASTPNEYPCVSPLARLQAQTGATEVASLRPRMVSLDDIYTRQLLPLLDGSRDRRAILTAMRPILTPSDGLKHANEKQWEEELETTLQGLATLGLLWESAEPEH